MAASLSPSQLVEAFGLIPEANPFVQLYTNIMGAVSKESQIPCKDPDSMDRYRNVLPNTEHRVKIKEPESVHMTDYLNASWISDRMIVGQAPTPLAMPNFWQAVYDHASIIVMLTRLQESDKVKAHQYWPELDDTISCGFTTVKCIGVAPHPMLSHLTIRSFIVTSYDPQAQPKLIQQLHYEDWSDHTNPKDMRHLENLLSIYREMDDSKDACPIIHCSAGIGRSSMFALGLMLRDRIVSGETIQVSDVVETMQLIRTRRPGAFNSSKHCEFAFRFCVYLQNTVKPLLA